MLWVLTPISATKIKAYIHESFTIRALCVRVDVGNVDENEKVVGPGKREAQTIR
jgi:hypothetical protein